MENISTNDTSLIECIKFTNSSNIQIDGNGFQFIFTGSNNYIFAFFTFNKCKNVTLINFNMTDGGVCWGRVGGGVILITTIIMINLFFNNVNSSFYIFNGVECFLEGYSLFLTFSVLDWYYRWLY